MKHFFTLTAALLLAMGLHAQDLSLKDVMGKYFHVGTALDTAFINGHLPDKAYRLVEQQFDAVVAEDCMKGENIHPAVDRYDWRDADKFVDWATAHHMYIIGHTLVWHSQPPRWQFTDEKGDTVSRDVMIGRMYHNIMTIMTRYKGRIKAWDVVNEAINDDGTLRETPYLKIIGSEYLELAFKFAREADPSATLIYNDYSMSKPEKRERVVQLIRDLRAKGIRIDAIGMQSHNGADYPDLAEWEKSIQAFAAEGVKVHISEMDMNMLPNPWNFAGADVSQKFEYDKKWNPYKDGLTKKAQKLFNERYTEIFRIIERNKQHIARVAFWGISDAKTWLNDWPIKGRTNYPTLFDRQYEPKPVVKEILELFRTH